MTFTRTLLFVSTFAAASAVPLVAAAQQPAQPAQPAPSANPNCPPGSWFCADTNTPPAAAPNQPVNGQNGQPLQPLPPPDQAQAAPAQPAHPPAVQYQPSPPPPVVVYQPPPPVMVVRPEAPPPYVYRPQAPPWWRRNEWGLNMHLEGAMIGRGTNGNASMGGLGFGLRYKPIPYFGIEGDFDFVGGRDYNDFQRNESAFTLNGLFFLNPRSRAQVYLLAGFGWSGAHVTDDRTTYYDREFSYSYFGGQAGIGLELRLGKHFALNGDLRGFIRGRTDDQAQYYPEFTDANGRTTNTSGGGLLTVGMTFYF